MERHIKVSTQGRVTIPKIIRDSLSIGDGQPIMIRSVEGKRQIVIELLPTISDFTRK